MFATLEFKIDHWLRDGLVNTDSTSSWDFKKPTSDGDEGPNGQCAPHFEAPLSVVSAPTLAVMKETIVSNGVETRVDGSMPRDLGLTGIPKNMLGPLECRIKIQFPGPVPTTPVALVVSTEMVDSLLELELVLNSEFKTESNRVHAHQLFDEMPIPMGFFDGGCTVGLELGALMAILDKGGGSISLAALNYLMGIRDKGGGAFFRVLQRTRWSRFRCN